jgi:alkyl hydroperoxide reductase subunit F
MLDASLVEQLRQHFSGLEHDYQFLVAPSEHGQQQELLDLLEGVASASERLSVRVEGSASPIPIFDFLREGHPTGIHFRGIPGGHEFTSLILAVLNADGKGRLPDEGVKSRVARIKGPVRLATYVSLECHNCPDVVQALNQMALVHPDFEHTMVDGGLVQQEVTDLGIQGVPSVMADSKLLHSGKADMGQLLDALEKHFGISEDVPVAVVEREPYDVLVLGGGPAGASAAVYSARKGLRVSVVARKVGGQVNDTKGIENQISVLYTEGPKLAAELRAHMEHYGVDILENREVETLVPKVEGGEFHSVHAKGGEVLHARQVIVATGARWRELGIPGEKDYMGSGVHFCPHCDGPFYKGKRVAVVGGGNSGIEAAIDLAGIASEVTVLEFLDVLRADQVLVDKARSLPNVKIHTSVRTAEVLGDGRKVTGIAYEERATGAMHQIELEGIFVQIGLAPNSNALQGVVELTPRAEVVIDDRNRTSVPGIYAAGDVTHIPYKQIIISMGEGAKASLAAFEDRMRGL